MISETKIHLSQAMTPVQAKAKGFNLSAILDSINIVVMAENVALKAENAALKAATSAIAAK